MLGNLSGFCCDMSSADFFQNQLFQKFFQGHYQSVKWFGSRLGLAFCRSWSGSKLFAKLISRWQNKIASKERVNCSTLPLYSHPIELTLKVLAKIVSENASVGIEANSVDPDQTAPVSSRGFWNISVDNESSQRFLWLFVCFVSCVASRPKSIAGRSVHLTTLFSWASLNKQ